jgi:hypothetical protein
MTQFLVNLCVRSAGSAGGQGCNNIATLTHRPSGRGQAVDDYHAMGARVAKLRATTMAGVIAKLLAAAPHVTEDELKDNAHSAVLAGAALDARALANVRIGEART